MKKIELLFEWACDICGEECWRDLESGVTLYITEGLTSISGK